MATEIQPVPPALGSRGDAGMKGAVTQRSAPRQQWLRRRSAASSLEHGVAVTALPGTWGPGWG